MGNITELETSASFLFSATHVGQMPTNNQGAVESDSTNSVSDNDLDNNSLSEAINLGNVSSNPSVKTADSSKLFDSSESVSNDERTLAPGIISAPVVNNFDASTSTAGTPGANTAAFKENPISADNPMPASVTSPTVPEATKTSKNSDTLSSSVFEAG